MTTGPLAALVALTPEAEEALGGRRAVSITNVPFRIGRADRDAPENGANDLSLVESEGHSRHISLEHCAIDLADTRFMLVDRGSACGTIVGGKRIGGNRKGGSTELRDGAEVVVGTHRSRYVFRFSLSDGAV